LCTSFNSGSHPFGRSFSERPGAATIIKARRARQSMACPAGFLLFWNPLWKKALAGGSFAPAQQVAESAGSLERLVAFTGRPVHV
jgi:hypothetical protein